MPSDLTREYSRRLGVLRAEQLQAALDRFGLGRLEDARPGARPLTGMNVWLRSSEGEFVLRGRPRDPDQLQHERFFCQLVCERTLVPVAWPYQVEPETDLFGWPFAIMPRLAGVPTGLPEARLALHSEAKLELARAAARTLTRLHELVWSRPARWSEPADALVPLEHSHAESVCARISARLSQARSADRVGSADEAFVEGVLERGREALSVPFRPTLVHGDYSEQNCVARVEFGRWQITGVFDFEFARVGDPEEDLAASIAAYLEEHADLARAFLREYTQKCHLRPGFRERLAVYLLDERLARWCGEGGSTLRGDPGQSLREWARAYVNLDPADLATFRSG